MYRSRPGADILKVLMTGILVLSVFSCRSTQDLVLNDPAFLQDMVDAAIAGDEFNITPEDYPDIRLLLSADDPDHRLAGVILARQTGSDIFLPRIAAAGLDPDPDVSGRALEIMKGDPETFRPALREMLDSDSPADRMGALKLLASVGSEDLIPLLISYFTDPDTDVRNQASLSVRALTDRNNPFLREALDSDDPIKAAMAIRTLGRYADPGDVEVFIGFLGSGESGVRREAQLAALKLGTAALPALHEKVADPASGYRMRLSALEVLQGLRSPDSLEVLIGLLVDDDARIAGKAQSVLGTYGVEAVPALVGLYRTSSGVFRIQAVRLMGEIGDPEAFPVLVEALEDESPEIRDTAYGILEEQGEDAWPALRQKVRRGERESTYSALNLLTKGSDPWLVRYDSGGFNTAALFLVITLEDRRSIERYLESVEASALVTETVLALKDAWEAGDEFAAQEADIAAGNDPYLYLWRQREMLSVASREALRLSFEKLHEYFETRDPEVLSEARDIRTESREMEEEARELKARMENLDPEVIRRGSERLEVYRKSRDFLVRTWEYIIPDLKPLAKKVYADRGLDPDALSREAALLD